MIPESDAAGHCRVMAHGMDDQSPYDDADNDGRNAVKQVRCIPDDERHRRPGIFIQVNSAQKPDWNSDDCRQQQDLTAADDRVRHPATGLTHRCG